MTLTEQAQRARVVEIVRGFIGTPYHHHGTIKGVGIDCATLLSETFRDAGMIDPVELPPYSPQWHIHREEEKYTDFIRQFATEISDRTPLIGDVVVFKFHRCFAHGAIVIGWPRIVHAFLGIGCLEDDAVQNRMLSTVSERVPTQGQPRPMKIFSCWGH